MDSKTEVKLASETLEDLAERIRQKRQEFLAHGVVGDEMDRDLEEMMHQHDRIRGAIEDERSPTRETLDAEVAVMKSMFERWVASNERRFAKSSS
jgi:hypothetical protein